MGRDRDAFEKAAGALRQRLAEGAAPQGESLPVQALASDLDISPTPVREALAHLAGEGLLARSRGGYQTIVYDQVALAELYDLAGLLAAAAVGEPPRSAPDAIPGAALPDLADLLTVGARNRALAVALGRVLAQLSPFATAEHTALGDRDGAALAEALRAGDGAARRLARAYFQRRARHADAILAVFLRRSSERAARNQRSKL